MHGPKTKTEKLLLAHQRHKGRGNYQFEGWYITPWGKFPSLREATNNAKIKRQDGEITISDDYTLQKYCKTYNNVSLNKNGRRTPSEWRGKKPVELGFDFKGK